MLRYASLWIIAAVAFLVTIGLIMLASTSYWVSGLSDPYLFVKKQSISLVIGMVLLIITVFFDSNKIRKYAFIALAGISFALCLCYVPGIGVEIYGSKRWVRIPGIGQFQPSEMARIIVVLALAAWFSRWQTQVKTFWRGFVLPCTLAGIPILLIAGETDVGTALSLSLCVGMILYAVGTRLLFLIPTALSSMVFVAYYLYNNPNRWKRILAWWDIENPAYQLSTNMQQLRSLLAFGNGGPWGVGIGNGVEKFGTLTFAHIDFIFPVIGEELGFMTLAIVFAFVIIAVYGIGISIHAGTMFEKCLSLGCTGIVVIPAIQNIAVTTAVMPNDGLPLPFISYGGTSLILNLISIGFLLGVNRRNIKTNHSQSMDPSIPLGQDMRQI